MKSTRRDFLKQAATAAAGVYGLSAVESRKVNAQEKKSGKSRVVIVTDPKMLPGETADLKAVRAALNRGIVALTGASSAEAAWKKLFKPSDVVGIKVNCIAGKGCSTRPEIAYAIADSLQTVGIKPENIIIWDRLERELIRSGYKICDEPGKVQVCATSGDFDENQTRQGKFYGRFARILSNRITALVNAPILKDHRMAGVTLAMKNHYGSFDRPSPFHSNNGDPFIADLNAVPMIRNKTRLIVGDALRALCNGGPGLRPQYMWNYNSLMLATDPVAIDYQGWQIIEARRREMGLSTLEEDGRAPRYISSAAAQGLGTDDPRKIQVIRI